jgi:DNA-binding MarR family transcriptional regulator
MVTAEGKRLYHRIVPLALAYEAQLLSGLKGRDIERLQQLLQRIEQAATATP